MAIVAMGIRNKVKRKKESQAAAARPKWISLRQPPRHHRHPRPPDQDVSVNCAISLLPINVSSYIRPQLSTMSASRASTSLLRALRTVPVLPRVGQTAISPRLFLARSLHSTPARLASEVPQDPLADPKIQAFYEKLRNHQGAVDAMMAVAKLMESKGGWASNSVWTSSC